MTRESISLRGRGARGESFADVARREGEDSAIGADPGDTDAEVLDKLVDAASGGVLGEVTAAKDAALSDIGDASTAALSDLDTASTEALADIEEAVADIEGSALAIDENTRTLAAVTGTRLFLAGAPRWSMIDGAYVPGSDPSAFYEFAVGIKLGENVRAGARLTAFDVMPYYGASATRLEFLLCSRPYDAAFIDGLPENGGDTEEWDDWVQVAVGALGFASGVHGTYRLVSPEGQAPVADGKSFYLRIRAFNGGTRYPLGYARGTPVPGSSGAKIARGFYRQTDVASAGSDTWQSITSTGSSLSIAVYDEEAELVA